MQLGALRPRGAALLGHAPADAARADGDKRRCPRCHVVIEAPDHPFLRKDRAPPQAGWMRSGPVAITRACAPPAMGKIIANQAQSRLKLMLSLDRAKMRFD